MRRLRPFCYLIRNVVIATPASAQPSIQSLPKACEEETNMRTDKICRTLCASAIALALSAHSAWGQTTSTPTASSSSLPPAQVIVFFMTHTDLLHTLLGPEDSTGTQQVQGYRYNVSAVSTELDDPANKISPATKSWIEANQVTDPASLPASGSAFGDFMTGLAVIKEQTTLMAAAQTDLALLQQLGVTDSRIANLQNVIQGYQNDIDTARAKVLAYAAAAISADPSTQSGNGGSGTASGAGSSQSTTDQQIAQAMDASEAEAAAEGDAIARAYADPNGTLNGTNQLVTSADADAIVNRITIAETATAATPVGTAPDTSDFTSTASDSPLTVISPNPIYKNYQVTAGQNGALVVTVPTLQVQTPTAVMTIPSNQVVVPSTQVAVTSTQVNIPSTQVNVPSSQVNVPSTQVNVPSTQVAVPSTQVQTPSDVMTSPDLEPSLCGR